MPPFRLRCCIVLLLVAVALGDSAPAVTVFPQAGGQAGSVFTSLAIVAGHPAIACSVQGTARGVYFSRAANASGTVWSSPVRVDNSTVPQGRVCLLIAGGRPAICFFDGLSRRLLFVRAVNGAGTLWSDAVPIDIGGDTPNGIAAEMVDGNPAVVCYVSQGSKIKFVRAANAGGSEWGPAMDVSPAGNYPFPSMKIVQGHPAIGYAGEGGVWFLRAADAAGSVWGSPVNVSTAQNARFSSLEVVNGRPVMCFSDGDLKMTHATADDGSAWAAAVTVDGTGISASLCSLAVVRGVPAAGYYDTAFQDVRYIEAVDPGGMEWHPPQTVDSFGNVGAAVSLIEADGRPSMAYHDATAGSVEFVRASNAGAGTETRWPPKLIVRQAGVPLLDGNACDFGVVAVGSSEELVFTLSNVNPGSNDLTIHDLIFDGPDAAEFSVIVPPAARLAATESTPFTVRYAPVIPGMKTATLHIRNNAEGFENRWDVVLTGSSSPGIDVEYPSGMPLNDGQTLELPSVVSGHSSDLVFSLRNPGGATLDGLAVSVEGPDAAAFLVIAPPASPLAPGAGTSFTVRCAPAAPGIKSAFLRVASNVPGSRNPFDIVLRMVPFLPDPFFQASSKAVTSIAIQGDGRILVSDADGLMRFHPDSSPDLSFFTPALDATIQCVAVQKNGGILIGGDFTRTNGLVRRGLARLLPDGTPDEAFVPAVDLPVRCFAVQPDGRILAGGIFNGDSTRPCFVRLNPDGSLDSEFTARPDNSVFCVALQPDAKVLAGGSFERISGSAAPRLTRVHADGAPDIFPAAPGSNVLCLAVQPDGGVLAGGALQSFGIRRYFPDGSRDSSVDLSGTGTVFDVALQADGRIFAAGDFLISAAGPFHHRLTRLRADGKMDDSFEADMSDAVTRVALQADGKVIAGGRFLRVGSMPRSNLARLNNGSAFTELKLHGRSTIRWLREGTTPEVSDVTFDFRSGPLAAWSPLGAGARIPGGWELDAPDLPAAGFLRAQGYAGRSVIETVSAIANPFESWRLQYFHTAAGTGDAADDADPDKDGLTNFTEFAFGLSPVDRASNSLPEFKYANNSLAATFTVPEGREDAIYGAESSATMQPGTWIAIPDSGTAPAHRFSLPANGERVFARFTVRLR